MKGCRRHLKLLAPHTMTEALAMVRGGARPFAGGTDLMVQIDADNCPWVHFVDLSRLKQLRKITLSKTHVTLGALTTYSDIIHHSKIQSLFPILIKCAQATGALAIQNRGTLGGNIANASPAADTPPVLLALDAELELVSSNGSRWVSYSAFHLGYKKTVLDPYEIIAAIRIPLVKKVHTYFRKVGTRNAQAISKTVLAGAIQIHKGKVTHFRLGLGSVAPMPIRGSSVERCVLGNQLTSHVIQNAVRSLHDDIKPIDDMRSTSFYRMRVTENCLREFLEGAL